MNLHHLALLLIVLYSEFKDSPLNIDQTKNRLLLDSQSRCQIFFTEFEDLNDHHQLTLKHQLNDF